MRFLKKSQIDFIHKIVSLPIDWNMRNIKGSGSYLKYQVRKNLAKAVLSLTLFLLIAIAVVFGIVLTLQFGLLEQIGVATLILPLITFFYFQRKYRIYEGGWKGEKQVVNLLKNRLGDEYFLINDLYLKAGGGDIDQIVLGPSGVFVLETKNWSGVITCNGDDWHRLGKPKFAGNPSLQVKRNATKVKRIIDNVDLKKELSVHSLLVFVNRNAVLKLKNPSVTVLKLSQLPDYIISLSKVNLYTSQELEALANVIVKQKH
jgi:hypothetical protein